jgi:CHAT domain-containing protein
MVIGGNSASVSDGIAALYQARGATALNAPGNADLSQLYRLIWQPLEPGLEGIGKVYYTKSGLLNQISMAALPTPAGELLAARFELFTKNGTDRLSIEREREALHAEKPGAVFYGGIDFDVSEQEGTSEKDGDLLASNSRSLFQDAGQRAGTTPWSYLEGTRKEVEQLTTQFRNAFGSLQRFEGAKATEASFKKVGRGGKSPDLLHIATHGFFLPEKEKGETGGPGFGNCENPLIRSGLLMAGGNLAWTGAPPTGGQEDGILTAYEIAMLDLKHTKLAVLSACETGLGELAGAGIGEEVHGLQRAFKLAGVEYVIMSLWKIPDAETVVFMNTFYNKWLSGAGVRQAFRATQLELSETYPPYAWAAFVLIN